MKKIAVFALLIALVVAVFAEGKSEQEGEMMSGGGIMVENYVVNGDFQMADAGWNIQFSEWGEGEESASWGLSTEKDNAPNTTQKLSIYNGMADAVDFTITQTVHLPAGDYVASVIFEGGPTGLNPQATLSVNGKEQSFEALGGWQNWKQVVVEGISGGGEVVIEIKGVLTSKMWIALDDIALVPKAEFTKKVFRRRR